ncbi:uncharacterized protein LOC132607730 [Lycium barbarum]|uniref:uncharacterized protein LOC132607730 n=1 Tax=Lycium barbarum TaxID=112863 RepID=UPI00293E5A2B|nr:uncharacterized protein LOC132607730 [Lycium barbarum]
MQNLNKSLVTTLVYAKCNEVERLHLWDDIYQVAYSINLPWLVGGDFNVVLHEEEKIGGIPIQSQDYEDFASCVNSCELMETNFKGSHFTWWNGRGGSDYIFERLDRFFISQHSQQWFAHVEVEHLSRTGSDHAPLLISLGEQSQKFIRPFRFLKFCTEHQDFLNILIIRDEIVRIKGDLFEDDPSPLNIIVLQQAQVELKKYLQFEEEFWRQKANVTWFAEGDRNT